MKKYLLLRWVGYWAHSGPDHGREPFFESKEKALQWVRKENYGLPEDWFRVVKINWPTEPPKPAQ